jgi:hypothetical protein
MTQYISTSRLRRPASAARLLAGTTIPEKAKAKMVLSTKSKLPLTYTAISPHAIIAQESESTNIDFKALKKD